MAMNKIISARDLKAGDIYLYQYVPDSPCLCLGDNYLDINEGVVCGSVGDEEQVMLIYDREFYGSIGHFRF